MLLLQPIQLLTTLLKRKRETKCIWKRSLLLLPLPKFSPQTTSLFSKGLYSLLYSLSYLSTISKKKSLSIKLLDVFVIFSPTSSPSTHKPESLNHFIWKFMILLLFINKFLPFIACLHLMDLEISKSDTRMNWQILECRSQFAMWVLVLGCNYHFC